MWQSAYDLDRHTLPLYTSSRNWDEIIFEFKVIKFFVTQTAITFCLSKSMVEILAKMAINFAVNYFRKMLRNCRLNIFSKFTFSPWKFQKSITDWFLIWWIETHICHAKVVIFVGKAEFHLYFIWYVRLNHVYICNFHFVRSHSLAFLFFITLGAFQRNINTYTKNKNLCSIDIIETKHSMQFISTFLELFLDLATSY